jgi:hypothetical protein
VSESNVLDAINTVSFPESASLAIQGLANVLVGLSDADSITVTPGDDVRFSVTITGSVDVTEAGEFINALKCPIPDTITKIDVVGGGEVLVWVDLSSSRFPEGVRKAVTNCRDDLIEHLRLFPNFGTGADARIGCCWSRRSISKNRSSKP